MFTLQCELTDDQLIKSESSILMTIANKASVDFKEFFGTVTRYVSSTPFGIPFCLPVRF